MSQWMQPFPESKLTGHFGKIRTFKGAPKNPHRGTDWALKNGTKIPAITDGKIMLIQQSKILGWVVVQSAKDSKGKIWYIGYCHLKEAPKQKKVGDVVKCGDIIALGGNTGSASSGPHLHATLSDSVKGVFAGNVFDLYKKINEEIKANPKAKSEVKTLEEPKTEPKAKTKEEPKVITEEEANKLLPKNNADYTSLEFLTMQEWKNFQQILKRDHGYEGAVDGVPGPKTFKALQRSAKEFGYEGEIDGVPGVNSYKAVQRRLVAKGFYDGRVDGSWGLKTSLAIRKAIETGKY